MEHAMPYDHNLAERIRAKLKTYPNIVEKKIFGGVGFLIHGNLACGVHEDDMIVRVGNENNAPALAQPFVRQFMPMPGKPMEGWILVAPQGLEAEANLHHWAELGYEYASKLPEKK